MTTKLSGKKILFDGDSICIGRRETGNWATRITERFSAVCPCYAAGGGTITENPPRFKAGGERHSVSASLERLHAEHPDADYLLIEGGTNDADLLGNAAAGEESRLGSYTDFDFSGSYDRDTFCGALESIFFRATQLFPDKKIGYIVAQKMGRGESSFKNRRHYFLAAIGICRKWGIPYIDLWETSYLNPNLPWMYDPTHTPEENLTDNRGYYFDGQHLTARGYDLTAELIGNWLLML